MRAICFLMALVLAPATTTDRPIVGVLSREYDPTLKYKKNSVSYVPASYVKAIEAAGARVALIHIDKPVSYYEDIMGKINGVVFPGRAFVEYNKKRGFVYAAGHIYNISKKLNDKGLKLPILAIGLGYEEMMKFANNGTNLLVPCSAKDSALRLNFTSGYNTSRLYKHAPQDVINTLSTLPVSKNTHNFCITKANLTKFKLDKEWRVLTTSKDAKGLEFVSSSESVHYPFVGLQFQPEKNAYEWNVEQKNPHGRKAISAARYFYDWLVDQARENENAFPTEKEEVDTLVYNHQPGYSGKMNFSHEQIYFY